MARIRSKNSDLPPPKIQTCGISAIIATIQRKVDRIDLRSADECNAGFRCPTLNFAHSERMPSQRRENDLDYGQTLDTQCSRFSGAFRAVAGVAIEQSPVNIMVLLAVSKVSLRRCHSEHNHREADRNSFS